MLCNQTTSYFDAAGVIACSSSKKDLPCLLVLAAQNPRGDQFMWLLNLNRNTFGTECNPVVSHSVGAHYFSLRGWISVARRTHFEHATQHSSSVTLSELPFFELNK